jgi:hypothetical protein
LGVVRIEDYHTLESWFPTRLGIIFGVKQMLPPALERAINEARKGEVLRKIQLILATL